MFSKEDQTYLEVWFTGWNELEDFFNDYVDSRAIHSAKRWMKKVVLRKCHDIKDYPYLTAEEAIHVLSQSS